MKLTIVKLRCTFRCARGESSLWIVKFKTIITTCMHKCLSRFQISSSQILPIWCRLKFKRQTCFALHGLTSDIVDFVTNGAGFAHKTCSILTAFTQCPDSGVELGRWVRSVLRGFIDPRLHSDPTQGADPASGADRTSSSKKFSWYTWKSSIHCAGRPSFLFTQKKKRSQTPHAGSNPTNWEEVKRRVRPPIGAGDLRLHWGAKGGVWPCIWGSTPTIGALCKHGNCVLSRPTHVSETLSKLGLQCSWTPTAPDNMFVSFFLHALETRVWWGSNYSCKNSFPKPNSD